MFGESHKSSDPCVAIFIRIDGYLNDLVEVGDHRSVCSWHSLSSLPNVEIVATTVAETINIP
jgi:hypothetical protein